VFWASHGVTSTPHISCQRVKGHFNLTEKYCILLLIYLYIYLYMVYLTTVNSSDYTELNCIMINKWWTGKDMQEISRSPLTQHLPGGTEENHKTPQVRVISVPAKINIEHLPITCQSLSTYYSLCRKNVLALNPLFIDWVHNAPRHGIFFNNSRWYRVKILRIFLLVHWSTNDTKYSSFGTYIVFYIW
jgi:hypothetical protein